MGYKERKIHNRDTGRTQVLISQWVKSKAGVAGKDGGLNIHP
jgi:hypothetical protein